VFHGIVAKIDYRGMETDLKPHAERGQISLRGPNGRHPIPAVKLFFENLAADLSQKLKSLFFAIAFRQQVDCRLSSEIVECEVRTRRIHSLKPVQERLPRPDLTTIANRLIMSTAIKSRS